MAADQQVALTRSHRMLSTSSHISKAARQVVPAFLQKLFEMVNDPNNADLIRWSESGDSFFVLDHERFAHEVLGRWFKHKNFSSFVRQLNMYGFYKIPHLQQGVLKSDTDTEFWNFAHANFLRGQPDLLCLIQRKKQAPHQGEDPAVAVELRDTNTGIGLIGGVNVPAVGIPPAASATQPNGQVLDVHSILSGINAIKRHQTTISAELNELKRSNQLLWQDALAARTRHQKQQDTINRIVKFLAGVFGNQAATSNSSGVSVSGATPGVPGQHVNRDESPNVPRRPIRLMIEDAKRDGPTKSMIEELTELPMLDSSIPYIDTPISVASPLPSLDNPFQTDPKNDAPTAAPIAQAPAPAPQKQVEESRREVSRAVTPSRSPSTIEFDPRISSMLNQLTPQIQQLLASLASQTITEPLSSSPPSGANNSNPTSTVTQYQPPFDFAQNQVPLDSLISADKFDTLPLSDANHSVVPSDQQHQEQRVEKQWQAAEDIDNDVNTVNTYINTLIQTFGLDPTLFEGVEQSSNEAPSPAINGTPSAIHSSDVPPPVSADFDFDTFFNAFPPVSAPDLPTGVANPDTVDMAAVGDLIGASILDDVQTPVVSPDLTPSPFQSLRQVSPDIGTSNGDRSTSGTANDAAASGVGAEAGNNGVQKSAGRKRKSDVIMDLDSALVSPGGKPKKRRDK